VTERIISQSGGWALGADSRRSKAKGGWSPVSFVASTRQVLERCCREKGCDDDTARYLLAGLPETFEAWKARQSLRRRAPRHVEEARA
jgi:hypothetical protein